MSRRSDMSGAMARKVNRTLLGMADAGTLDELEERFLQESGKILPADCLCWNHWAADWSHMVACRSNEQHDSWLIANRDLFHHFVGLHPVLAANPISATARQVMRMSDYQRPTEFKQKNPFYREVYRHLGFVYQVSYTAASLPDRKIILSWSREQLDFSDADVQVFHRMGRLLGVVSREVMERERLDTAWRDLCGFVDSRMRAGTVLALGAREAGLLARLMKGDTPADLVRDLGVRRDSVDKQLGSIRERLGLENHRQLLSALAELRGPAPTGE